MIRRYALWGYGQRLWVEIVLVLCVIGMLVYLQAKITFSYTISAELVGPVYIARDMQMQMLLHSAVTGEWPEDKDLSVYGENIPGVLSSYSVSRDGHLLLHLEHDKPEINDQYLAFNLYEQEASPGYKIYVWRCGGAANQEPFKTHAPYTSTVLPHYTNVVCRNRL